MDKSSFDLIKLANAHAIYQEALLSHGGWRSTKFLLGEV
jgi:hypothetical protein